MMARSKRSVKKDELWRGMMEEQRRGGLSIRAFCRKNAVSEPSFYAWRKRLQERDAERVVNAGGNGRLIPVEVIGLTGENATRSSGDVKEPLEICTPGGFTLRFGHDAMPDTIARLLDVIAQAPTGTTQRSAAGATSC
jgi:hypothetical protein